MRRKEIHWREDQAPPSDRVRVWDKQERAYGQFRVVPRGELKAMQADEALLVKEAEVDFDEDEETWEEDDAAV